MRMINIQYWIKVMPYNLRNIFSVAQIDNLIQIHFNYLNSSLKSVLCISSIRTVFNTYFLYDIANIFF